MKDTATLVKHNYPLEKLGRLNILLVEDNPVNVKLISILLFQHDLKLQLAQNGEEAIEKIKENDFDIILMDIEMPVMDGYEATTIIRQQLKKNVPIIAMTANSRNGEREKCLRLGMNEYIQKPINEDFLFSLINELTSCRIIYKKENGIAVHERTMTGKKVCNLAYLLNAVRENKKALHDIINIFLKETPGELAKLQAAIGKADHKVINDIAHKLKSSFSLIGITLLTPIFEEMELNSTASGIEKIKQLNSRVTGVFEQAKAEMEFETQTFL